MLAAEGPRFTSLLRSIQPQRCSGAVPQLLPCRAEGFVTSLTKTVNCDCAYSFFCLLPSQSPTLTSAPIWTIYLS